MQLMKIMPSPRLASMVRPTWLRVASSSVARSNCTEDLSLLATLALYCLSLSLTNLVSKRRVGHGLHHGVGNMADAAEARDFERQFGGRDIHPHAADDDRHQFLFAEVQAEIIDTFHFDLLV